jgi:acetyltransferase-like isoleucine patch superfamily enzyme
VVNAEVTLGDLCIVNTGATLDHEVSVGMGAHIAPGVAISGNVKVGDLAMMGVGSCAIQGVSVGKGAMVGAGAAVVRDIPDGALAVGVPARVRRKAD